MGNNTDRTWFGRLWVFAKILLVYVLLGPPVGALTFFAAIGLSSNSPEGPLAGGFWLSLFGLIYGVPFSYFVGSVPAAAVASIVAAGRLIFGTISIWLSASAGLAAGIWLSHSGIRTIQDASTSPTVLAILIATCVVPATLCGLVSRRI